MAAYSPRFDDAIALAVSAFRPIRRKGSGAPYVTHLFAVTAMVGEHGGDEDQLIAAMLHDYIEDIPGATAEQLVDRFGERVARLVVDLSDCEGHPKPPWRDRKVAYIDALRTKQADVKLISAADKVHNARTIVDDHRRLGNAIFERFNGRRDGTLWYYAELVPALRYDWAHPLVDELERTVELLHTLAQRG